MLEKTVGQTELVQPFYYQEAFESVGHKTNGDHILEKITPCHLTEELIIDGATLKEAFGYQMGGSKESFPKIEISGRREMIVPFPDTQQILYDVLDGRFVRRYVLISNQFGAKVVTGQTIRGEEYFEIIGNGKDVYFSIQDMGQSALNRISILQQQAKVSENLPFGADVREEKSRISTLFDVCRQEQSKYELTHSSDKTRKQPGLASTAISAFKH